MIPMNKHQDGSSASQQQQKITKQIGHQEPFLYRKKISSLEKIIEKNFEAASIDEKNQIQIEEGGQFLKKMKERKEREERMKRLLKKKTENRIVCEKELQKYIRKRSNDVVRRMQRKSSTVLPYVLTQTDVEKRDDILINRDFSKKLSTEKSNAIKKKPPIIYRGMQTHKLKQFLWGKQLSELNTRIEEQQKMLIRKYGPLEPSPLKRRKYFLPEIKSASHFQY